MARKKPVDALPRATLRVLALDALMRYQELGLRQEGDSLFPAIVNDWPGDADAE